MPLGTLDRTPPPFFRQGHSALTRLLFFASLALLTMVADTRFELAAQARMAIATVLYPLQRVLLAPVAVLGDGGRYLHGLGAALAAEQQAQQALARQSLALARAVQLEAENAALRELLGLSAALAQRATAAEVLFEAADPHVRRLVVDRGSTHGVVAGSAALAAAGVVGQVTRVFPLSSEVTLLVDPGATIAVLNARTGQRWLAGGGLRRGTAMGLRFVPAHADLAEGDLLTTSGVDGVYPGGLAVARIARIERQGEGEFAHVLLQPAASPDAVRHLLLVEPMAARMPESGPGRGPARPAADGGVAR
jgi:rod shape-determining protein MreC